MIQTKLVNLRHAVWVLVWRLPKLCVPFVILLSFYNYSCVHHFPVHVALLWLQMYADYIARVGYLHKISFIYTSLIEERMILVSY